MPGSSNFNDWNPTNANQESDAAYTADAQRSGGAVSGPFPAATANKLFRQVSVFIAALGDMLATKGYTVSDVSRSTLAGVLSNLITQADPVVQYTNSHWGTFQGAIGPIVTLLVPSGVANNQYRISFGIKVIQAASTSSTIGPFTVTYTDPDGTTQTITLGAVSRSGVAESSDSGNTLTTVLLGVPTLINCAPATNISFSIAYASSGGTPMQYTYNTKLENMGSHA